MNNLFSHVPVRDNRNLDRYFNLIKHYVDNPYNGKGEDHHILPKSLGGKDGPLVLLSHRAHYVAHHMLFKAIGGAMTYAFHYMTHNKKYPDSKITSRVYDVLREENAKHQSESQMGEKSHRYGKKHTAESRKKISEATKGEKNHNYGRKGENHASYGSKRSDETKKKMRENHVGFTGKKGTPRSAETKKKISETMTGRKRGKYKI